MEYAYISHTFFFQSLSRKHDWGNNAHAPTLKSMRAHLSEDELTSLQELARSDLHEFKFSFLVVAGEGVA